MLPLVVFHSPRPLAARLAAAIYLGRLPRRAPGDGELGAALAHLAGGAPVAGLLEPAGGLRPAGRDGAGRPVYTLGAGAGPGVVVRSFSGLAAILGVPEGHYLLAGLPGGLPESLLPPLLGPERACRWLVRRYWAPAAALALAAEDALARPLPGPAVGWP